MSVPRRRRRLLPLALSAVVLSGAVIAPARGADPEPSPSETFEYPVPELTAAGAFDARLRADVATLTQAQTEAQAAYETARAEFAAVSRQLARQQDAVDQARRIIAQYARTIYMFGPTDLSVIASMIDSADPAGTMDSTDAALRAGEHKNTEYLEAKLLVARTESTAARVQQALEAAEARLTSVRAQVTALHRQLADTTGAWSHQLASMSTLSAAQAQANSEAAAQWAAYLATLADARIPSVTAEDLSAGRLPEGMTAVPANPAVLRYRAGGRTVTVVPEPVVAAVTYAVSALGTPYKWHTNTAAAMDCSSLVDRSWNLVDGGGPRDLVDGGVAGLAEGMRLVRARKLTAGDVVYLTDPGHGVHHAGIAVDDDTMIAADAITGGVNAVPIPADRVWRVGRLAAPAPRAGNRVPKATKRAFQCGADPAAFMALPDGGVLADPASCPPSSAFGEYRLQPAAVAVGRCAARLWPQLQVIGGWRPSDPYPDHPSGRAVDIMMPAGCSAEAGNVALGNAIATFFMEHADRFHVQYMIWQQRTWTAGSAEVPPQQWRTMSNRGDCTSNHMDHVHVTVVGPNLVAPEPEAKRPVDRPDRPKGTKQ